MSTSGPDRPEDPTNEPAADPPEAPEAPEPGAGAEPLWPVAAADPPWPVAAAEPPEPAPSVSAFEPPEPPEPGAEPPAPAETARAPEPGAEPPAETARAPEPGAEPPAPAETARAPEPGAAPSESEGARAPGWYPDPDGSGWRRYWDGSNWSSASPEQLSVAASELDGAAVDRRRRIAQVTVVGVVLAAIVAVIVATGSSGRHTTATDVAGASATTAATTSAPATATTTTTSSAPAPVTVAQVHSTLNAFVAAYNARSLAGLSAVFAPSLVRRVIGHSPQNLATALALYAAQFGATPNPDLVLADVKVAPGIGQAGAGAHYGVYAHNRRTRGTMIFHFTASGQKLLIDRLRLTVH